MSLLRVLVAQFLCLSCSIAAGQTAPPLESLQLTNRTAGGKLTCDGTFVHKLVPNSEYELKFQSAVAITELVQRMLKPPAVRLTYVASPTNVQTVSIVVPNDPTLNNAELSYTLEVSPWEISYRLHLVADVAKLEFSATIVNRTLLDWPLRRVSLAHEAASFDHDKTTEQVLAATTTVGGGKTSCAKLELVLINGLSVTDYRPSRAIFLPPLLELPPAVDNAKWPILLALDRQIAVPPGKLHYVTPQGHDRMISWPNGPGTSVADGQEFKFAIPEDSLRIIQTKVVPSYSNQQLLQGILSYRKTDTVSFRIDNRTRSPFDNVEVENQLFPVPAAGSATGEVVRPPVAEKLNVRTASWESIQAVCQASCQNLEDVLRDRKKIKDLEDSLVGFREKLRSLQQEELQQAASGVAAIVRATQTKIANCKCDIQRTLEMLAKARFEFESALAKYDSKSE